MFSLFLILLGNITLSVVSTQYYLQTLEVREISTSNNDHVLVGAAVVNEAMWVIVLVTFISAKYLGAKVGSKVRKIDATGRVTVVVGPETMDGSCFSGLYGDPTGDILYLSQEYNQAIWRHNISSNITVQIAGKREWIYMSLPNPNVEKSELGDNGPATLASLEWFP
eukprot:gene2975-3162_t